MSEIAQRLANLSPAKMQLLQQRLQQQPRIAEPIAIVGMACRFPGAPNLDAYWRLIHERIDATGEIPSTRWDVDGLFDPTGEQTGKMSVRWAGMVEGVEQFDPQFFGISPREASRMDPQQRLLLEVAWEALEIACLSPERMCGSRTGVFVGIGGTDYSKIPAQFPDYFHHIDAHVGTGNALSIAANRLSYILDLRGPSVAVDTACSSGLIGVHLAVQSLRSRECDAALAGGVNLILTPETTIAFSKARMLSADGQCRPFDAAANGYVRGEGCGILVLKRLTEAVRDGDQVLAIIRASAANQDGRTSGITAPNGLAQQAVIREALSQAGLSTDRVSYIEAHGTATPLGDPIEVEALGELFRGRGGAASPCYLTSVKANIGHTETVSGIAGMIKVVLMMRHRIVPGQLHLKSLNPRISLTGTRLRIPTEPLPWKSEGGTRIAGVSSFGFGGTNAHVILEEAAPQETSASPVERPLQLLALSAKTDHALTEMAKRFGDFLQSSPGVSLADVAFSANAGRAHFLHRAAIVAKDTAEMQKRLRAVATGETAAATKVGRCRLTAAPRIGFLFTGQGSQYVGMARSLYETQPTFRKILDQCEEILQDDLEQPLLKVIFAGSDEHALLHETAYTQPALFAIEYALARLWQSWGVEPSVVLGHSVGEYAAACIAGIFSLEDGLRLIAARGRLMQQLPHDGSMAVIFAPVDRVEPAIARLRDHVSIAAYNGPENIVISGATAAVRTLVEQFERDGISTQQLTVSHAFHSPLMEPMLDEFERVAASIAHQLPRVPLVSNLTGQLMTGEAPDANYWREHVRNPVRFAQGMQVLAEQELQAVLEVGPATTLIGMGRRCLPQSKLVWLASLRKGQDDWGNLLQGLSELYVLGTKVDWRGFDSDYHRRRLIVPTYPFERSRHWFEPTTSGARQAAPVHGPLLHPLLGSRVPSPVAVQLFEGRLSCHWPAFLVDHQVQGSPVFPAAGYVEQSLAVGQQVFGAGSHLVENLSIQHAMFLPEGQTRVVQVTVSPESGGQCSLETYSVLSDADVATSRWTLHCTATVRHGETLQEQRPAQLDLASIRERTKRRTGAEEFYHQLMASRGLVYGPNFQPLDGLVRNEREVFGDIHLSAQVVKESSEYQLHPALGDALFQISAGLVPLEPDGSYSPFTYMPTHVRRVRVWERPTGTLFVYGIRRSTSDQPSPETVEGDLWLVDEHGNVLAEFIGIVIQRVGRSRAAGGEVDTARWLYQIEWEPASPDTNGTATAGSATGSKDHWLIFSDRTGVSHDLAAQLLATGARCVMVEPGERFEKLPANDSYRLRPRHEDDYRQLLDELGGDSSACTGVLHLWSLDLPDPAAGPASPWEQLRDQGCGSILPLVRQLARRKWTTTPSLLLITRGAQPVTAADQIAVFQSPVWGLGRVAQVEHPELKVRLLDLDAGEPANTCASRVRAELSAPPALSQLAYRQGQRLTARLRRAEALLERTAAEDGESVMSVPQDKPFRLRLGTPGSFDSLRYEPLTRAAPGPGKVELQVRATGLNFSDVLKAMGLYPGITDEIVPLGIECSGVITAIGEGVTRFRVGDPVMGVAPYSFASHAITADYALTRKPAAFSDEEAATVPITFLTAHYGLVRLAQLQPGERVLIHAAAGGVGLAAIQIAQQIGAEIFATAGSDSKRDFLRSLGVSHVFSSRTLEFADEIRRVTHREGVDVVLNSLPGDAITKSISLLRAYGRFLEIGKIDIYQNRMIGLLPFQDNLSYHAIDLDRMLRQRADYIRGLYDELMPFFEKGLYRPLPATQFGVERTIEAFRYMAQRKNTGKVVVTISDPQKSDAATGESQQAAPSSQRIRADGTYLITGGLGALGRQLADWLAEQGARNIALLGRRAPGGEAAAAVEQLRSHGVEVVLLQGDVTDRASLTKALATLPPSFPPIRGVFHAAGVLQDGLLLEMTAEQLDRPLAPKVWGAWNLHEATRDCPLDLFVMFSSVACVLGSPGQANYAAGNAFLDALAAFRHQQGLPAISVNWGPWAGEGMAGDAALVEQLRSRGMELLPATHAWQTLDKLLQSKAVNAAVMDARWPNLLRGFSGRVPSLLAEFAEQEGAGAPAAADAVDHAFRQQLLALEHAERAARLRDYLAQELCRIMGIERDQLDIAQPLNQIGMDSLLAMELKNNLERKLAFQIPMAAFLEGPSVTTLADHAAQALAPAAAGDTKPSDDSTAGAISSWNPLVTLRSGGSEAPVFCLHPLGGDIQCYREFAQAVTQRPVYALRGRGSEGLLDPHPSLGAMIEDYLAVLKSVQPQGPYHLASWSAGGIFSYELARRLHARGEEIGLLMLFDTPLPSIYQRVRLDDPIAFMLDLGNFANWFSGSEIDLAHLSYENLKTMSEEARWEFAWQLAKSHGVVPPDTSPNHLRRIVAAGHAHAVMILNYEIVPFGQTVHLVRPENPDVLGTMTGQQLPHDLGWGKVLGNKLVMHEVPGDHFTIMQRSHVAALASILQHCWPAPHGRPRMQASASSESVRS